VSIAARIRRPATLHVWSVGGREPGSGDYSGPGFADVPTVVEVQQQQTSERRDGAVVVTSVWTALFRPPDAGEFGVAALKATDEFTVQPEGRFAIEGDPWLVRRPSTQRATHWFAHLRKVG
jgi:hypothetical protein